MRLPLSGGQWAELRERLLYGPARDIRVIVVRIEGNPEAKADLDLALVRAYVSEWHVLDLSGQSVPLDQPELAPDDVIQAIAIKAIDLWRKNPGLPKVGPRHSPTTRRGRQ